MTKSNRIYCCIVLGVLLATPSMMTGQDRSEVKATLAQAPSMEPQPVSTEARERDLTIWEWPALTGMWGGKREALTDDGIVFEGILKTDFFSSPVGGIDRLYNADLKLDIDFGRLAGFDGMTAQIYGLGNGGTRPSDRYAVAQAVSSIEAQPDWRLYTFNIQQQFFGGDASVLIGLYDLNSEFCTLTSAALFVNSSFGIGPELAQTGEGGPSIFPVTSAGIRLMAAPAADWTISCAVLDGVPGDPAQPTGTHIVFNANDGMLLISEAAYAPESEAGQTIKVALGAWMYTASFDDLVETTAEGSSMQRADNAGFYLLAEHPIIANTCTAFLRFGYANAHVNRFENSYTAGINLFSLVQEGDIAGIAFCTAASGGEFRQTADPCSIGNETVIEASYLTSVTPWLALQPDVQFYFHPDGNEQSPAAVSAGMRLQLIF